jgi:hypothetical protein
MKVNLSNPWKPCTVPSRSLTPTLRHPPRLVLEHIARSTSSMGVREQPV